MLPSNYRYHLRNRHAEPPTFRTSRVTSHEGYWARWESQSKMGKYHLAMSAMTAMSPMSAKSLEMSTKLAMCSEYFGGIRGLWARIKGFISDWVALLIGVAVRGLIRLRQDELRHARLDEFMFNGDSRIKIWDQMDENFKSGRNHVTDLLLPSENIWRYRSNIWMGMTKVPFSRWLHL